MTGVQTFALPIYLKNLNYAKSFLEFTDQTLGEMAESMMRVKELAISQAGDAGANEETRRVAATEVQQIFDSMVSAGNRKLGDRFIFGGFKTQRAPFLKDGSYRGDDGEMLIHTDKTAFLPMNVPGGQVLLGEGLSSDGIMKPKMKQAATIEEFIHQKTGKAPQPQDPQNVKPGSEKSAPGASPAAPNVSPEKVELRAPADPELALHLTQVMTPDADLAATADTLRAALATQPPDIFGEFVALDHRAGRAAVTYRERRPPHDVRWTVLVDNRVRIAIGCQYPRQRSTEVDAICERAVRTARRIG